MNSTRALIIKPLKNKYHYGLLLIFSASLILHIASCNLRPITITERFVPADTGIADQKDTVIPAAVYYDDNVLLMEDKTYFSSIKSVKLFKTGFDFALPAIPLNGAEQLTLVFDDLHANLADYKYRLIHCDDNWNPTGQMTIDYIEGFPEDFILDYKYSLGTLQKYIHYSLTFPTENLKPKVSGNYIIAVYKDSYPAGVILTRRFMIFEPLLHIEGLVKRPTIVEYRTWRQEIDFTINKASLPEANPYRDFFVVIRQNGRWDNAIYDIKPKMVLNNILDYNYERENLFDGINEFRHFDLRSLSKYTPSVDLIRQDTGKVIVNIKPDIRRAYDVYISHEDINGNYLIMNEDALQDPAVEADYAWVHFTLPFDNALSDGAIYIMGGFTNWRFSPEYRRKYNKERQAYETQLYLKQGYYNYLYVVLENNKESANTDLTEGNHFETENNYYIYVYYHDKSSYYDRLLAVKALNSSIKD